MKRTRDYRDTVQELTISQPAISAVLVFNNGSVSLIQHKPVGRSWKFRGKPCYIAKVVTYYDKEKQESRDVLEAYDPLAEWRERCKERAKIHSPENLFDAIHWSEVNDVYRKGSLFMEKLKMGLIVVCIGLLCFFSYVVFSSFMGK